VKRAGNTVPVDAGRSVAVGPDTARVMASGQPVDVVEMIVHEGGEPPLHLHRNEDEWFYVVEGEIAFWVDGAKVEGGPGTFAYAPQEVPHTYAVRSGIAKMLIGSNTANFSRIFNAFAALPADVTPEQAGAVMDEFGIVMLGPNPGYPG
jgi:quercetin dioxygenase-like cupin family protein